MQTQPGEQSGRALLCASASGSSRNYRCSLNPTLGAYTAGMALHWKPDVSGAGGPTTLNVDTLGAAPVKLRDGASDPAATDIAAGELYDIWYDGARVRLMAPLPSLAAGSDLPRDGRHCAGFPDSGGGTADLVTEGAKLSLTVEPPSVAVA